MPWKDRYTISDERTLLDSEVRWPDGRRCCFRIVVDLAPSCGPEGITPADLTTPDAYFGMHGGLKALCGVLDQLWPQGDLRRAGRDGGDPRRHDPPPGWRGPRDRRPRLQARGREPARRATDERARLGRTTEILAKVAGQRPSGWFSLARPGDKFAGGADQPEHDRSAAGGRLRLFRQRPGRRRCRTTG